jgi:Phosphotransferase enzyme family
VTPPAQSQIMNVVDHPASVAWQRLKQGRVPVSIERLGRGKRKAKSALWRLVGGSPSGGPIIAKLSRAATIAVESRVYQTILSPLGMTAPRCYGHVECDDHTSWLFLDEVSGVRYEEQHTAHRRAASAWLGQMHAATNRARFVAPLVPVVTLNRYQRYIEVALANMSCRTGADTPIEVKPAVNLAASAVARLQRSWPEVQRVWSASPQCVVHGDFISKNVLVEARGAKCDIHVLDWEASGWGVPAEDLAGLDLAVYRSHGLEMWCAHGRGQLESLAGIGAAFRAIAFLSNYSKGLKVGWFGDVPEIAHHGSALAATLDRIGL